MRRPLILLLVIALTTLTANSQYVFKKETNLGVKAGGTLSMVTFDPKVDQKLNFGFTGGLVFKHVEQKSLGIQLEVNFLQAGWTESLDTTNSYSRRLNYIQIPFMTHVIFGEGKTRFFLNLGPYGTFLLSEKEHINLIEGEEGNEYYGQDIDSKAEFGLCAGIGLSKNTSIGMFQLEGRFNFSLSNMFDSSESVFTSSKNQTIELSLSYLLDYHALKRGSSKK